MKIVCLSDTHNQHWKIKIPDGDILIHAGDFSFYGRQHEVTDFNEWLGTLPHTYKIVCPGNHEVEVEDNLEFSKQLLSNADHILIDSGVEIGQLKIWGSPYTPEFGGWGFSYGKREAELRWQQIPSGLDILITHGPPKYILDSNGQISVGCPELLREVQRAAPKYHVFGHIHESGGSATIDGVHYHNVSQLDGDYRLSTRTPLVIDL